MSYGFLVSSWDPPITKRDITANAEEQSALCEIRELSDERAEFNLGIVVLPKMTKTEQRTYVMSMKNDFVNAPSFVNAQNGQDELWV